MRRRSRSAGGALRARPDRHGRHGRSGRSPVVRPPLPPLETREERFDLAVASVADYLGAAWEDLREVSFEVADMPTEADDDGIPRWRVETDAKRITLYRLPVERLVGPHRDDEGHRRAAIEGTVFRAAAEYLDRDPWDLGPDRFRFS